MSNGSKAATRPGHTMPMGADPDTEDGFTLVVHHCALLLKSFLTETVALMVQ